MCGGVALGAAGSGRQHRPGLAGRGFLTVAVQGCANHEVPAPPAPLLTAKWAQCYSISMALSLPLLLESTTDLCKMLSSGLTWAGKVCLEPGCGCPWPHKTPS